MKKWLFIFVFLPVWCFGQSTIIRTKPVSDNPSAPNYNRQPVSDASLTVPLTLVVPVTTTTPTLNNALPVNGAIQVVTGTNSLYIYSNGQWRQVGSHDTTYYTTPISGSGTFPDPLRVNADTIRSGGYRVVINPVTGYWGRDTVSLKPTVPGGSNTQVQYNNSGVFGANANFAWDNVNDRLNIGQPYSVDGTRALNLLGGISLNTSSTGGGTPYYIFPSSTFIGGNTLRFASNSSEQMTLGYTGGARVGISGMAPTFKGLEADGPDSLSSSSAFLAQNFSPGRGVFAPLFRINDDGKIFMYMVPDGLTTDSIIVHKSTGQLAKIAASTLTGVASVSGTTNRITSTGGTNPVIDISSTFEGLLGKVANPLSQFASTTSAQFAGVISNETGSNLVVFNTSPTLVTPILGTPTSVTLTNGTGLPISTGISGLGTGIATFLTTPSSANFFSAITDETGSGAVVGAVSPALTGTPTVPTATSGTNTTQAASTAFVTSAVTTAGGSYLKIANNFSDLNSVTAARSTLGVAYSLPYTIRNNFMVSWYGDSLTAGGSGYSVPAVSQFGTLSGANVFNGGIGGQISSTIYTRWLADTARQKYGQIEWWGRNNFTDTTTVMNNYRSFKTQMASIGNTKYVVIGVIKQRVSTEYTGTTNALLIDGLNSKLSTLFGSHFLDIEPILVAAYNPAIPQDVIDHGHGVPPFSLHAINDSLHLNTSGYLLVAKSIPIAQLRDTVTIVTNQNLRGFDIAQDNKDIAIGGSYKIGGNIAAFIPDQQIYTGTMYFGTGVTGGTGWGPNGPLNISHVSGNDATYNFFGGIFAGNSLTTGYRNTMITPNASTSLTAGYQNTGVGYFEFPDLTIGYDNTSIGFYNGGGLITGHDNTLVGGNIASLSSSLANTVIIADGSNNQIININALTGTGANKVLATPNGSGGAGSYRALVVNDLFGGTGASSTTFLSGAGTWVAPFALTTTGSGAATFISGTLNIPTPAAGATGATPSALVGLTAIPGSSANFTRADGAPALDQTIAPTMTGKWIWNGAFTASAGLAQQSAWTPTFTAAASNDALVTEDITPNVTNYGVISALGTVVGGSSYTNGSYTNVPLSGGYGSGATANITVSGGAVTVATIVSGGKNYQSTDVLSALAANIGGTGSGFTVAISTIQYTGLVTAGVRLNYSSLGGLAGTNQSQSAIVIRNTTTATLGQTNISPNYEYNVNAWGTTGSTSQPIRFWTNVLGIQSTVATGQWQVVSLVNGTQTVAMTVSASGAVVANSAITSIRSNLATTTSEVFGALNSTNTTAGTTVQYGGSFSSSGGAWNTTALANQVVDMGMHTVPVSGNPVSGQLVFTHKLNGGTEATDFTIASGGQITSPFYGKGMIATSSTGVFSAFADGTGAQSLGMSDDGTTYKYRAAPVVLATVTGINAKSTGTTALFTVPAGKTLIVTAVIVRCTAATAITVGPSADIGDNTIGAASVYANTAINGLTTTTKDFGYSTVGMSSQIAAASIVNFNINTASTGTSQTIAVDLIGYLE